MWCVLNSVKAQEEEKKNICYLDNASRPCPTLFINVDEKFEAART